MEDKNRPSSSPSEPTQHARSAGSKDPSNQASAHSLTEYQFLEGRIADCEQKIAALFRDNEDTQKQLTLFSQFQEWWESLWESDIKPLMSFLSVLHQRQLNMANCGKCGRAVPRGGMCMCKTQHAG